MAKRPNQVLVDILLKAYSPCQNFGACREARWAPGEGHVPRGFLGATGELCDVKLVMVFSEPGRPHADEHYSVSLSPLELLDHALAHADSCFRSGKDQFHQNVRWFISQLYPGLPFD